MPFFPEHFPDPRFFLLDLCFTPTCAKWEAHCKPELENTIWGGNLAVPGEGWAERDDVMVTGATRLAYQAANGELSSLAPPIAQAHQDTRFNMISVEVHAGVAVKSGYCFFCLHNESKPFAIRAKPYHPPAQERHVVGHLIDLWESDHRELLPASKPKWGEHYKAPADALSAPMKHRCPDLACQFNQIDMLS